MKELIDKDQIIEEKKKRAKPDDLIKIYETLIQVIKNL